MGVLCIHTWNFSFNYRYCADVMAVIRIGVLGFRIYVYETPYEEYFIKIMRNA